MMKIAFLMQCHKNPEQINLLLKALKHPQVDVYVHVDSKSESIREDIGEGDGIYLLPKKDSIDVQWGQFSQVQATLNLLNAAISGGGTLAWVGEHSLEVYLTHYLLLSLIRLDKAPTLYSPMGLSLVLVNYVITVALTVMAIVMMSQNAVLRFILTGKKK